ncbi:MAG: Lactam utilization protein LamB [Proteobacteria bacterium]|nr:Lactam utilization protein LamB [Pseudomonadota bacterium]
MTAVLPRAVDLNADLGEGFGAYRIGDDAALLEVVTSANVACGLHAGDPEIMAETFRLAKAGGVAVGAHPGFPDLWGFGRRVLPYSAGEIERLIAYQIGAAAALSALAGHPITYVKLHGALANLAVADSDVAAASIRAIRGVDASLACLAIAHGRQDRLARDAGLATFSEVYADRGYLDDGRLMPRAQPGAFVHDPATAVERACRMVLTGEIVSVAGKALPTSVDSICVHGDNPTALVTARLLRERLAVEGVALVSFAGKA